MSETLGALAAALGLPVEGDRTLPIRRAAEPAQAGPEDLAIVLKPAYAAQLAAGRARAALIWADGDWRALGLAGAIRAGEPRGALARLTQHLDRAPEPAAPGIHPAALIAPDARIGPDSAIGPFAVIEAGAEIGPRARIGAHAVIGPGVRIGADARIATGVRIAHGVRIGDRVRLQMNACLGGDGFSFAPPEAAGDGHRRIHALGGLSLGHDVEIGVGTAVDRGTIADTEIGNGVKIDNLVQIGHNVRIGDHVLVCGGVGIGGSTRIGEWVVIGGQASIADNITIGPGAMVAGGAGVGAHVPAGRVVAGHPAGPVSAFRESFRLTRRLPRLFERVGALEKRVSNPEPGR